MIIDGVISFRDSDYLRVSYFGISLKNQTKRRLIKQDFWTRWEGVSLVAQWVSCDWYDCIVHQIHLLRDWLLIHGCVRLELCSHFYYRLDMLISFADDTFLEDRVSGRNRRQTQNQNILLSLICCLTFDLVILHLEVFPRKPSWMCIKI